MAVGVLWSYIICWFSMFIEWELLWVFALYVRRMVNIVIQTCVFFMSRTTCHLTFYLQLHRFLCWRFHSNVRVPVGIPRMSLGHLSDTSGINMHQLYTNIRTHWMGCNWASSTNAFKHRLLGSHSFVDLQDVSVYIINMLCTSIVRPPWNLLSSLGHKVFDLVM